MRFPLTRVRAAMGWTFLALAGLTALILTVLTYASQDLSLTQALGWAWLLGPLPLAAVGAFLHFTCRSLRLDLSARTLQAPGAPPLSLDKARALWLLTGGSAEAGNADWRLFLITDAMGAPLLDALASAAEDLAPGATAPLGPHLKRTGALETLRAPTPAGLLPILQTRWERAALGLSAELSQQLRLPIFDMTAPLQPVLRKPI